MPSYRHCVSFCLIYLLANAAQAQSIADPTVRAGNAVIEGVGSNDVRIRQQTDKAVIDWRAFSIDAGSSVQFVQPGAGSIALNRITGSGGTRIDGSLLANGQVWLLNPNGVLIGASGRVTAGGFLATTHAMSNEDFLAGNYSFGAGDGSPGSVTNAGIITAAEGGYAVLAGNQVGNSGLVQARLGQVVLGSGKAFTIDVSGDRLLSFAVTEPLSVLPLGGSAVDNSGNISAQGGRVLLTARAAASVTRNVINTTGVIDATSVRLQNGEIVLDGGDSGTVFAAGTLDVSGKAAGQTGGAIKAFGDTVVVGDQGLLDARGAIGGGRILVGGGWQGETIDGHASAVRVGVSSNATLDASATDTGDGGTIVLWSNVRNPASKTLAHGSFYAVGGANGGNGGRIETSGGNLSTTGAQGSAAASKGKAGLWLFDPYDVEIVDPKPGVAVPIVFDNTGNYIGRSNDGSFVAASGGFTWQPTGSASRIDVAQVTGFLNGGTNVRIATGGASSPGTQAGIITVNSAIHKTIGGAATLQLDAQNKIVVNQAIDTAGNALNLIFNAGVGGIFVNAAIDTRSGGVTFNSAGALELNNAFTVGAPSLLQAAGEIRLGSAAQVRANSSAAADIVLSAGTRFSNAAGSNAVLTTGNARWLIYSQSPQGNVFGGLASGTNALWGQTLSSAPPQTIAQSGNRYIFADSPVVRVTALDAAKTYGDSLAASQLAYRVSGLVNAESFGNVFLQDNLTGTPGFKSDGFAIRAPVGSYALTPVQGSLVAPAGYSLGFTSALLTISQRALVASLTGSVTKTYDGTNVASLAAGNYELSNLVAGDVVGLSTSALGTYDNRNAGTGKTVSVAGIALTGADAGNYSVNSAASAAIGTINQRSLVAALTGTVTKTYDGTTAASLTAGNYALSNLIAGDAVTLNNPVAGAYDNRNAGTGKTVNVAGLALTGADAGNYFVNGTASAAIGTINQRSLVASLTGTVSKTYDGTNAATLAAGNYALSNLVAGDAVTLNNPVTGAYDNRNAGTGKTVSVAGLALTGADAGNYLVNTSASAAIGTINQRSLVASLTGTVTKTYDGTNAASLAPGNYALSNLVAGDAVSLNNPVSGTYDSRDAGTGKIVSVAGLALTGADAGNYLVNGSASGAIGSINQRSLVASLTGTVSKTYDGTSAATLAAGNYALSNLVGGDSVSLNNPVNGTFDNRNAGTGKSVSVAGLALIGTDAGNYSVNASASAGIGTITQRTLVASLTGTVTKTYDGTTAATLAAGNYALSNLVAGDAVGLNTATLGTYDNRNAGTGKIVSISGITLTGADAGNYLVNSAASGAIGTINQRALVASLTGTVSKTYDGTTAASLAAGNYALSNLVAGDVVGLTSPANGTFDNRNAGTGKTVSVTGLALAGADAGNYSVNAAASGAIGTITQRALVASLTGTVTKTYDGTTAASLATGNYALSDVIGGDAVALNAPAAGTYDNRNAGAGKTVSVAGLALTGADAGNYSVNTAASGAIGTINQRSLVASLTGTISKTYDGTTSAALTASNYALSNAISGDAVAVNGPASGSYDNRNAGTGKTVSVAGLALTGADAGNYSVNTAATGAIGTINQRALMASLTGSVGKIYDGTTAATLDPSNYALSNTVSGDAVALNNPVSGRFDTPNTGIGKIVSVAGLALTGADAGNYFVNSATSAAIGQIALRALVVSLTGTVSKTYDGTTAAALTPGNYVLSNLVGGEAISLSGPATGTFDSRNAGTGKMVTVTGITLTGADAANYLVNGTASAAIGTINQRSLIASLTGSVTKTYDGTNVASLAAGNYALSNLVAGDAVGLSTSAPGTYDNRNAGTGKTVSVAGIALTGADAGNYLVNSSASAAIGTINQRALTASLAGIVTKTYDGTSAATLAADNYALANAIGGDAVALNFPASGTFDNRNAGTGKTVSVAGLALTGADAGNYIVNGAASATIGTITQRALTASLTGTVTKTYDGTTAASLAPSNYALSNLVVGDAVTLNSPVSGSFDNRNAGTGKTVSVAGLALTGADAGNYLVNGAASGAIGTINQRALIASLTGTVTRTYDGTTAAALAAGNYALSNMVAGDAVGLNNPSTGTFDNRNAGTGKTVSVAGLALTGADAGNYLVNSAASGVIGTINQRALTASLTGTVTKTYDGTDAASLSAGNYALSNLVAGDAVTLNNPASGTFDNRNAGTAKTVSVAGLALTGADAGNYSINTSASAAIGTINQRSLVVSLTGTVSKTYDGTNTASLAAGNYALGNAISGDAVSLSTPANGTFDNRNSGTGKTVSVAGLALSGADAGNYLVNSSASGAIGTITQRTLVASLTGTVTKTYDGTTAASLSAGNYALSNLIAGDAVGLNTSTLGTFDNRDAGIGKTVSVAGITLTGADAGNYLVNSSASAAIGTINQRALTASLTGTVSKVANGSTLALLGPANFALSGFVAGETALINQSIGEYATASTGTGIIVSTGLAAANFEAASGTNLANYVLPTGGLSGPIGTITAPVQNTILSKLAVLPSTSISSAPPAPSAVSGADKGAGAAAPASQTPKDAADSNDPILAAVNVSEGDGPAPNEVRQKNASFEIVPGVLSEQRPLPPRLGDVPGLDQAFSGAGKQF
ncbi:beta strand repeat-containing protein [Sphingomonas humi]|uniref:beta strand repeat-containing protein n=1 Tax=Sphingomonas humi TaxID=335630 RepID=UPI0031D605A9